MFNRLRYRLAILGLMVPLVAQAVCTTKICDFSFTTIPTFASLCLGTIESGIYTITNNRSVPILITYIRIQSNDSLPVAASAIVATPNQCTAGSTLAPGASCNIQVNLQPLALGTYNRILQVGVNTHQGELDSPVIAAAVNCLPAAPPGFAAFNNASIIAHETITNTGPTIINGDLDLSPGTSITGFPPGTVINGAIHATDATAATALANANVFFTTQNALACTQTFAVPTDLGGLTLTPGVYCGLSSLSLSSTLTLSGAGAYTFKAASTLITLPGSAVILTNGATSANLNWIVGSSATLGTTTAFAGNIVAQSSVTFNTGATLNGRAAALTGAVTLDSNIVNPT